MNARELRIGNYFKWIYTQKVGTVEKIVEYDRSHCAVNSVSISDCEPIPLTEEWLERFGFKISRSFNGTDASTNDFNLWKFEYLDYWEYWGIEVKGDNYYYETAVKIKFVHQLQNLYFTLRGQELTILK